MKNDAALKPPSIATRAAALKSKIENQKPAPLGKAPVPADAPRIIPDPLMKGKK